MIIIFYGYQGENDIEQLCQVLRVLGTPNEKIWPVSFCIVCCWDKKKFLSISSLLFIPEFFGALDSAYCKNRYLCWWLSNKHALFYSQTTPLIWVSNMRMHDL